MYLTDLDFNVTQQLTISLHNTCLIYPEMVHALDTIGKHG